MKRFIIVSLLCVAAIQGLETTAEPETSHGPSETKPLNDTVPDGSSLRENRIAGGQAAARGRFPWMAKLEIMFLGIIPLSYCGGSLIDSQWILTAAHCVAGLPASYRITLGAVNPYNIFDRGMVVRRSNIPAIVFPFYNRSNLLANDIALLRLPKPVAYTASIQPIELPSRSQASQSFEGETVTTAGWGSDGDYNIFNNKYLKYTELKVVPNSQCPMEVGSPVVCTSENALQSSCVGDSGSPLFLEERGRTIQIGITSGTYGRNPRQCPSPYSVIYTKVPAFIDWIQCVTGISIN